MRINKFLASCGVASRRESDRLIEEGRVKVNGKVVKQLGVDIDEYCDKVLVDGKAVALQEQKVYLMLHKPKGYITSVSDEKGRKTVMDLINGYDGQRLFPIGRLDYDSEGLLIITNDGDLAYRLTHPSCEITKTYVAKVAGEITPADIKNLMQGVVIDGKKTLPCQARLVNYANSVSRVEIVIREGRNRQVRKMFEQGLNKEVVFLKRTMVGDLRLGGLVRGQFRELNAKEMKYLRVL